MPTSQFYGYSPDVLEYNSSLGVFVLDPNFDPNQDRTLFEVEDNDGFFDGDRTRNEIGDDSDQAGIVRDGAGNEIANGTIYIEQVALVRAPDGTEVQLHRIEVEGQHVGYVSSQPLIAGEEYDYLGQYNVGQNIGGSDTRDGYTFYEQNAVPCFGPGTMITTQDGEIPVEWLDTGHKVLTRDHGYQPILWVGRTKLPGRYFEQFPEERPVLIAAGALGENYPKRDLHLTGDHRVLIRSVTAQLMFFSSEVFAPAKAWVDMGIGTVVLPEEACTLTHFLCASHEVIMAEGAWVESMFTGAETLRRLGQRNMCQLDESLAADLHHTSTARPCLSRKEAALLLSQVHNERQNHPARIA